MTVPGGETPHPRLRLGARRYDLARRALVMAVLDCTDRDGSLRRAETGVAAGADLLDIAGAGGPDGLARSVEALTARFGVPISVHAADPDALEAALAAGAVLVNGGGLGDPDFLQTALKAGASVVARSPNVDAGRPDIEETIASARVAGFAADEIVVDIGLDVGKTHAQSALLLRESDRLAALGYPLLLSAANEPFPGREASLVAAAYGMAHGCRILRVDDVAGIVRVARTIERILEARAEKEDHPK